MGKMEGLIYSAYQSSKQKHIKERKEIYEKYGKDAMKPLYDPVGNIYGYQLIKPDDWNEQKDKKKKKEKWSWV